MSEFKSILHMQFRHLLKRKEWKFAFTAMMIIITIAFAEVCNATAGSDVTEQYSAASGWIGRLGMHPYSNIMPFFIISEFIFCQQLLFQTAIWKTKS